MTILVRAIQSDELAWVDEQYQSIGFVATNSGDRQFVAEIAHQRVGLGRLACRREAQHSVR